MDRVYRVIHWSLNFSDGGTKVLTFSSLKDAEHYVSEFKGRTNWHYKDTFEILEVLATGSATEIDHDLVGFKLTPKKV
jgi:hypothetical protein